MRRPYRTSKVWSNTWENGISRKDFDSSAAAVGVSCSMVLFSLLPVLSKVGLRGGIQQEETMMMHVVSSTPSSHYVVGHFSHCDWVRDVARRSW